MTPKSWPAPLKACYHCYDCLETYVISAGVLPLSRFQNLLLYFQFHLLWKWSRINFSKAHVRVSIVASECHIHVSGPGVPLSVDP